MRSTYFENSLFAVAILVFGIMAGFFWTYTFNVNRAMLLVDGQTYATVQSLFNENVRHFMFFMFFFGGAGFSILALAGNFRHRRTLPFWCMAAAAIVYAVGVIAYTSAVNLPLNVITEAWDPNQMPADWKSVRAQWNNANAIRVGTSGLSFVLALMALVVRASGASEG